MHCPYCNGVMASDFLRHQEGTPGYICLSCGRSDDLKHENYILKKRKRLSFYRKNQDELPGDREGGYKGVR